MKSSIAHSATAEPEVTIQPSDGPSRLAVMNFLNESAERFPNAISLASGRPRSDFFEMGSWDDAEGRFRAWAGDRGQGVRDKGLLAQYGPTAGIINELVAAQLKNDEGLDCSGRHVLVTSGCQEAMALLVPSICSQPGDVILARSVTYIGITGVADLAGVPIEPIASTTGDFCSDILSSIDRCRVNGLRPRLLYLVPDFDNPTGVVLAEDVRRQVIELCFQHGIVVLEDNPYGMFRYEGHDVPRMAAIDERGAVIYLGTYSKTLFPAARVGCAVIPSLLLGSEVKAESLYAACVERKSFITVNTGQLSQAVVGGHLIANDCSLLSSIRGARKFYHGNRDTLLGSLETHFGGMPGASWNRPAGGFFLGLDLPIRFGREEVEHCARDFGVLVMPMSFFAIDDSGQHDCSVRLAFSNASPPALQEGIERLAKFVESRVTV